MSARHIESTAMANRTTVARRSEREIVITRTIDGPARLVFEAWTRPELFARWWVPRSIDLVLLSCEQDVRVGGTYRLVFDRGDAEPIAFFGQYLEVTPCSRLVWTNEESGDAGAVSTLTLEERAGRTLMVMTERYRSKEACDAGMASGAYDAMGETFDQLDQLLVTTGASAGPA